MFSFFIFKEVIFSSYNNMFLSDFFLVNIAINKYKAIIRKEEVVFCETLYNILNLINYVLYISKLLSVNSKCSCHKNKHLRLMNKLTGFI